MQTPNLHRVQSAREDAVSYHGALKRSGDYRDEYHFQNDILAKVFASYARRQYPEFSVTRFDGFKVEIEY